ncbi:MAG TPA: PRC-barrel domain-containing protein [Candidatus Sulfotelmatobacter sp.]
MAQYGMLRDYSFSEAAEDIRGSRLHGANNEKLGKIDDVIFDYSSGQIRYVVVDTGGWLSTKKFVVPADRIRAASEFEEGEEGYAVDLSKEQIESLPPYQETDLESDEQWADYEGKYRSKWESGPVMHRKETDRNITPTTQQMVGNASSERAAGLPSGSATPSFSNSADNKTNVRADAAAAEASTGRVVPAGVDTVVISNSASGIGDRWDTFQSRLRERRKEAAGTGAATRAESGADTWRKAV